MDEEKRWNTGIYSYLSPDTMRSMISCQVNESGIHIQIKRWLTEIPAWRRELFKNAAYVILEKTLEEFKDHPKPTSKKVKDRFIEDFQLWGDTQERLGLIGAPFDFDSMVEHFKKALNLNPVLGTVLDVGLETLAASHPEKVDAIVTDLDKVTKGG